MGCHKGDKIVLNDRTERKKKKKKVKMKEIGQKI